MRIPFALAITIFLSTFAFSQSGSDKPNIFLDCQMRCDRMYVRQEIQFVNYMMNRHEADVYILATRQRTGAGGSEIQLVFQGDKKYAGISDTIIYQVEPMATDVIWRETLVKHLKKGLLPYILKSPLGKNITYEVDLDESQEPENVEDPWDYWVFNIGGNAYLNGEASNQNADLTLRFNVSRVTDKNKFLFNFRYNYDRGKFTLTDGEEIISIRKRINNFFRYVISLNDNWSAGITGNAGSSTFGNTDFDATLKPAIEYNIFPYEEATTRRFTFLYSIGPKYNDYTDITIFDKLRETLWRHNLEIEFEQTQKWGDISIDIGVNQYLHDLSLYSVFLNPNIEWVIFKGFSLDLGGFISFVGDRINIAKSDISDEDILLQIKQLDTDYEFFTYLGLNYRFGSSYNNFVNPRF